VDSLAVRRRSPDNEKVSCSRKWRWVSIAVLLAAALSHAESKKPAEYRDPQNRFSLAAPKGWKLRPLGDSVQVVREDSYVSVIVFDHSNDARETIDTLSQNIGKKWRNFQSAGTGEATLSGCPAEMATFSGTNPQGIDAVLQLQCVVSGNTAYVVVISAPKSQFAQESLADIVSSFTLLGGAPVSRDEKPTLGVELTDLSADDATLYGLGEPSGALVINLAENGPAQLAGVKLHDVVIAANGQAIDSAASLEQAVTTRKPGDELILEVVRIGEDGKRVRETLRARIGSESGRP
jgi:hypothetical protein